MHVNCNSAADVFGLITIFLLRSWILMARRSIVDQVRVSALFVVVCGRDVVASVSTPQLCDLQPTVHVTKHRRRNRMTNEPPMRTLPPTRPPTRPVFGQSSSRSRQ